MNKHMPFLDDLPLKEEMRPTSFEREADLLEALKQIARIQTAEPMAASSMSRIARAAIAKAEGKK